MSNYLDRIKNLGINNNEEGEKPISKNSVRNISYTGSDEDRNILKTFTSVNKKTPEEVAINNSLTKFFLNDNEKKLIDAPMECWRILFLILGAVKNSQVSVTREVQLKLFEEEFLTKSNSFFSIKLQTRQINFQQKKERIKFAVDYLQKHFTHWVEDYNFQNKPVQSKLSLIEKPSFTRGNLYFESSVYWLEKFVVLRDFNSVLFELPFKLFNSKYLFFALNLELLPVDVFTPFKLETLNNRFNLDYKKKSDFARLFLNPLRCELNKINKKSFQFKIENNLILIMPYHLKKIDENELKLSYQLKEKIKDKYTYFYWKKRHKLSDSEIEKIKYYFERKTEEKIELEIAYKDFVRDCKQKKIKTTEFVSVEFLKELQKHIINNYKNSKASKLFPNGYLTIV